VTERPNEGKHRNASWALHHMSTFSLDILTKIPTRQMTWPNTPIHVGVINEALQYKNRGNCYSKKKTTHIRDRAHSRLGTGTSIKMAGAN